MTLRIVVLDGYTANPGDLSWAALERLGEVVVYDRTADDQIVARSAGADVLVTNKTPLWNETLDQLPDVKFISVLATGVNNVDLDAAAARGIAVSNVPAYSTAAVAQYSFALLLELCHHIAHHDTQVRDGRWTAGPHFCFWDSPQIELDGKTIGLIGFGQIGSRVAAIAAAMGMKVLASTRTPKPQPALAGFEWVSPEALFSRADVVSLHCPLTAANAGFVDRRLLERMKPTAMLINTARGGLVNETDLAAALNQDAIAGAGLDVVAEEPIRPDNPLLTAKNCLITPHIAWATRAARGRLIQMTADNIAAFAAGTPIHRVNAIP